MNILSCLWVLPTQRRDEWYTTPHFDFMFLKTYHKIQYNFLQAGKACLDISLAISQKIRKQPFSKTLLGIHPKDIQPCHKDMC